MVIDSMGIGAMPDCREFNDTEKCNTLRNVCEFNKGKCSKYAKNGFR